MILFGNGDPYDDLPLSKVLSQHLSWFMRCIENSGKNTIIILWWIL